MPKAITLRISTGEILNHNYSLSEEVAQAGSDQLGLDPDLKVLIYHEPFSRPTVDGAYYTVQTVKTVTTDPHPTYPNFDKYEITYLTPKRPIEDIKIVAENAEVDALYSLFPNNEQIFTLALGIGVIFRSADGLQLTAKETAIKNKCLQIAAKIWRNRDELIAKKTLIDAGEEPDLESWPEKASV